MMGIGLALVFLFVLFSGGLRSVEMGCQNTQQRYLKNIWLCAVSSYTVAFTGFLVFLGLYAMLSDRPKWPTLSDVSHMPWWAPFGGLVGGVAVVGMIVAARYIGAATFNAVVIVSEMIVALIMDNFGLMGFTVHHANGARFLATGLITVAVVLLARDIPTTATELPAATASIGKELL
jgi:bacterial/archaeal transporter family-2 protein